MPCLNELDHVERLTHLETIQQIHASAIKKTADALDTLSDTFKKIKYGFWGALILYALNTLGLSEFLKKVI